MDPRAESRDTRNDGADIIAGAAIPGATTRLARTSRERQREESQRRRRPPSAPSLPVSAFASHPRPIDVEAPRTHPAMWLAIGTACALLGQFCGWFFFAEAGAWNGSLLFTLCGLGAYIYPIFRRNTEEIWSGHERPATANRRLALDLSSLFAGILIGFALPPAVVGVDAYLAVFADIGDRVEAHRAALHGVGFAEIPDLALHNLRVAAAFFLISLVFRYLGLLFVVIFNAALWGVLGCDLIAGGASGLGLGGAGRLMIAASILPHLIVELTAYVAAAMAGVFTSRCLTRYRIGSVAFVYVTRSVLGVVAVAVGLVIVAAAVESLVAGGVVDALSPEAERLPIPHHLHDHAHEPDHLLDPAATGQGL